MRRILIILALLAGSLVPGPTASVASTPACSTTPVEFGAPLTLTPPGRGGYEPGIEIDSQGTVFVTAHKLSLTNEAARLASWLWRSVDDGRSFQPVAGPAGATEQLLALEGDFGIDAHDRLYFADTWATDDFFYRYSDHGATLDFVRPIVPSQEALDDRPWVAAHGDGHVYYMGNLGITNMGGRQTVYRSTDGGQTFSNGFRVPDSGWGYIEADPNSPYVYVFVDDDASSLDVWVSPDYGATWTTHPVADFDLARTTNFPNVAVSPVDGTVYITWNDGNERVMLGESTDNGATWTVTDVTPFSGAFRFPWVNVGPTGDVGLIFQADPTEVSGSENFVYGMIWRPESNCLRNPSDASSLCTGPAAAYARLQTGSTGDERSQVDFFQDEFSADNALNVPYTDDVAGGVIKYTRQTSGPNLTGEPMCGTNGTP